ncbi:DNAj heat shock n-terminal domain-containing protein [Chrysochromulina tobinii]|uniref:DNAj heat shock n-terminal domain-containing protein n=1 Tax=Chrysochromulina tobinii TaxID=1460289 RepID=A0A0M0JV91_9EUKA|nr:DNAj heat shock n-terminal domain-containing protein [Chrysochromulina tobinii]|eukprot:KOO30445.1 DNAj heat shock n-terminal domain-containing protein [Chrysochromulina sp. CCMP291]
MAELLEQAPLFDTGVTAAVPAASPKLPSELTVPPSAPSAPPSAPSADEPDPEKDYAGWCRAQGNRLFREAEYGQACAWYGHAIVSLERGEGVGVDAPAADGSPPRGAIATLLSNRAASWLKLGRYPEHRALRALLLSALTALERYDAADLLCEAQLHATPEAPELLHAAARLVFIRQGADACLAALTEVDVADTATHAQSAELHGRCKALLALQEDAKLALSSGNADAAVTISCGALCLAEEISSGASQPSDHERLLLVRARAFLTIGQPAQAIADFRSAAALNPAGSQAGAGLKEAWRLLQLLQKRSSLYEVLGCEPNATAEQLRKAYHKAALKWHPDKHTQADAAQQAEAHARFTELQAAWAVLSDETTRAEYDADHKGG